MRLMIKTIKRAAVLAAAAFISVSAAPTVSLRTNAASGATDVKQDGLFVYDEVDGGYAVKRMIASTMTSFPSVVNGIPIVEIEENAFYNCTGVTEIEIPQTVKKIGDGAFSFCSSLEKVTIPHTVTEIPDNAFIGCEKLEKVELPDSITRIGDSAFSNCTSLKELNIPDKLTEIGDSAFTRAPLTAIDTDGCENYVFKDGYLMDKKETEIYRGSADLSGELRIPENIKTIKSGAFSQCYGVEEIFFPGSVSEIGSNAFWDCCNVKKIDFSEGLYSIGEGAFTYNELVQTIELPISLKTIGKDAFLGCASLDHLILQDGLESIGEQAFYGCGNLKQVSVPKSVKEIGNMAFGYTINSSGNGEDIKIDGFKMNVSSGSEAAKYAKSNDIDFTASDKDLRSFAFRAAGLALAVAAIVFGVVLMARGRKGAPASARKAKKEAREKEEEASYKKIIDDDEPAEKNSSEKKSPAKQDTAKNSSGEKKNPASGKAQKNSKKSSGSSGKKSGK